MSNLLFRAVTKAKANLRDILVRVHVKLDKNCKLISEPENNGTIKAKGIIMAICGVFPMRRTTLQSIFP